MCEISRGSCPLFTKPNRISAGSPAKNSRNKRTINFMSEEMAKNAYVWWQREGTQKQWQHQGMQRNLLQ